MGLRAARPAGHRGEPIRIPEIPDDELRARLKRLGRVLNTSANSIHHQIVRSLVLVPYSNVRVKTDVPRSVLAYVSERPEQFPGVKVEQAYLRDYPHGELAAQILGYVGQIGPAQLKEQRYKGVKQGTVVGQDGLERTYDKYLRGQPGVRRVQVDANGRPIPNARLKDSKPVSGQRLRLSLDLGLEEEGAKAIAGPAEPRLATPARSWRWTRATASCSRWAPSRRSTRRSSRSRSPRSATRRSSATARATGPGRSSTARSPAAIRRPRRSSRSPRSPASTRTSSPPATTVDDPGCIQVGEVEALQREQAGLRHRRPRAGAAGLLRRLLLQARRCTRSTAATSPARRSSSSAGRAGSASTARPASTCPATSTAAARSPIPRGATRSTPRSAPVARRRRSRVGANVYQAGALGCGRSDLRDYNLGDTVNLAIGQGDVQASPLQMAIAYAAIENGGKIVQPHLGLEIETPDARARPAHRARSGAQGPHRPGRPRRRAQRAAPRRERARRHLVRRLRRAGTTTRYPIYGKTGTATRDRKEDQSWYIAYVPDRERPIVVAVTVEEGGFGAAVAAPIACRMLAALLQAGRRRLRGGSGDVAMNEPPATRIPAGLRLPFDPLLALATLGLMAASIVSLERDDRRARRPAPVRDPPGDLLRDRDGARRSSSAAWTTRACAS